MIGPLSKTFGVLASSDDPEAVELLLATLESPHNALALAGVQTLLDRPGAQGQREILTRFSQLAPSVQQALQARSERFDAVLRQLLLQDAPDQRQEGLNGIRRLLAVDQIPQLIQLLCRDDLADAGAVTQCLLDLVALLGETVRGTSVADTARNGVLARRDRALSYFEQAINSKYEALQAKDAVIECVLMLGPAKHQAVKLVLWQAAADCRERAGRMLLTSRHPRVMRQVIESLQQPYPHPKAFEAVRTRTDLEFLCELLRTTGNGINPTLEQNLKQIDHLDWLEGEDVPFRLIPQPLQPALLSFVFSTKVAAEFKALTQDWLLRHGGTAGRMAAAEKAALLDEDVIQDVLVDSLDAEDEHVQAWAVTQLRQHAVPATFGLLLDRLDSPSAEVRAAVREELSDFNLERVLGMLNSLDRTTAPRVGELLRQIDPHVCEKLEKELKQSIRPRRVRAVHAVVKLGYARLLLKPLLAMARDQDVILRRTLAEELGAVLEPEVLPVLDGLVQDPHPRVRDAAQRAVQQWHEQSAEALDPLMTT